MTDIFSIPEGFEWLLIAILIIAALGAVFLIGERIYSSVKFINDKLKQRKTRNKPWKKK